MTTVKVAVRPHHMNGWRVIVAYASVNKLCSFESTQSYYGADKEETIERAIEQTLLVFVERYKPTMRRKLQAAFDSIYWEE